MFKVALFLFLFLSSAAYSILVYTVGTEGPACDAAATRGKQLFQDNNCTACHQLHGLGGYLGPDLTHAWSQPGKGAAWCSAMLKYGNERMPSYHLTSSQVNDLLAFLAYVDGAGKNKDVEGKIILDK